MKTPSEIKPPFKAIPTGNLVTASMGYGGVVQISGLLDHIKTKASVMAMRLERVTKGVYINVHFYG